MFSGVVFHTPFFFFSSRRRHTRYIGDWSSDVCSSDLEAGCLCHQGQYGGPRGGGGGEGHRAGRVGVRSGGGNRCAGPRASAPRPRQKPGGRRGSASHPRRSEERRVGKEWSTGRVAEER